MKEIVFIAGVGYVSVERELLDQLYDKAWRELFACDCADPTGIIIPTWRYYHGN